MLVAQANFSGVNNLSPIAARDFISSSNFRTLLSIVAGDNPKFLYSRLSYLVKLRISTLLPEIT